MENYDWKFNFKLNILCLRIMGLWPKNETFKFNLYLILTFTFYTSFIICHVSFQAINIYFIRDNLSAVAGTSYILLIKILSAIKGYFLMKNMKLLREVLDILEMDLFRPKTSSHIQIIKKNLFSWRVLQSTYVGSCYASNFFFTIYPLVDKSSERRLPFLAWYPFDSKVSPNYEITYIYQVLAVFYNTSVHVNVDSLICVFNFYAGLQFDILADNLRKFVHENEDFSKETENRLMECILHHKLILEYIQKCNKFLNWIVLIQFFVSAVSIGITMFQLTLVTPFSNQFNSLLFYWAAITAQIFLFCWFGNEVQEKSVDVPYAVFESDWINLPPKIKKMLLFFTMNLMKPIRLSALDLFYLTLDTFTRIMKTAWSYFAFLHQIGSRK